MDNSLVRLDRDSGKTYVGQIAASLRAAIEAGALEPDERLPPARALAAELDVNFNTVARAYRSLARDGYLESRPGRGTRVRHLERVSPAARLEAEMMEFLQQLYRLGYTPQDVRWEFAAAIRTWIQDGEPPAA